MFEIVFKFFTLAVITINFIFGVFASIYLLVTQSTKFMPYILILSTISVVLIISFLLYKKFK